MGVGLGVAVGTGVGVFVGVEVGAGVGVTVGSAHVAAKVMSLSIFIATGLEVATDDGASPTHRTNSVLHEAVTMTVVPLAYLSSPLFGNARTLPNVSGLAIACRR